MKTKKQHLVPMSHQVLKAFQNLRNVNTDSAYVFPTSRNTSKPITADSLRLALRRVGVGKDKMTPHGFRSMASTRLNELGYSADVIEIQLSHLPVNKVRAVYNHAEYLDERRLMMQEWSDYLDKIQNKETASTLAYQQNLF